MSAEDQLRDHEEILSRLVGRIVLLERKTSAMGESQSVTLCRVREELDKLNSIAAGGPSTPSNTGNLNGSTCVSTEDETRAVEANKETAAEDDVQWAGRIAEQPVVEDDITLAMMDAGEILAEEWLVGPGRISTRLFVTMLYRDMRDART